MLTATRGAALALVLLSWPSADHLRAQGEYLDYRTFAAWKALVPELGHPLLCNLTDVGHELWAAGQLRLPVAGAGLARGDFRRAGRDDWAVLLRGDADQSPCDYVLITTQRTGGWERLLLHRITLDPDAPVVELVWNEARGAIGIDVGARARLTAPATLTSVNGHVVAAKAGYVIEQRLISRRLRWNPETKRFDSEQEAEPEAWDIEQSSRSP